MGHHQGKHDATEQQKHQVQETPAAFYRSIGGDVDGPLNGETVLVDAVHVDVIALHAGIGHINRYMPAELVDLETSAVVRGDAG